jgi:HAE1 family hydrophobic/amphiphilic exporter-1
MLVTFLAVIGATALLYVVVPKGFIPDTDNDQFNVQMQAQQGTSYYQMIRYG